MSSQDFGYGYGSRTKSEFIKHKETSDVDASDSQDHGLVGLLVDLHVSKARWMRLAFRSELLHSRNLRTSNSSAVERGGEEHLQVLRPQGINHPVIQNMGNVRRIKGCSQVLVDMQTLSMGAALSQLSLERLVMGEAIRGEARREEAQTVAHALAQTQIRAVGGS